MISEERIYHITRSTHNTKISPRMIKHKIELGEPVILSTEMEREITATIAKIILEGQLKVYAYNICQNHVHILIACKESMRDNIVRKLKGKSTQFYKKNHNITKPLHLRGQKYNWREIKDREYLSNVHNYILNNREKHGLVHDIELKKIIEGIVTR